MLRVVLHTVVLRYIGLLLNEHPFFLPQILFSWNMQVLKEQNHNSGTRFRETFIQVLWIPYANITGILENKFAGPLNFYHLGYDVIHSRS